MSSTLATYLTAIGCFIGGLVGCEIVRRIALARSLLDAPNERSLHSVPTPRLGGVAIVGSVLIASTATWSLSSWEIKALAGIGGVVALVGLRDDLKPMSASVRIVLQIAAAVGFLWGVGVPPLLVTGSFALPLPKLVTGALLVVWIVGLLNIYNFMDGMDGLAGTQTVSAGAAFAMLSTGGASSFAAGLAAAAGGFLVHNAPPARLFMGDAGSTFIGMSFAALGVLGMHHGLPITVSALALSPFLLDGTFTIVRRARRGERVWQAHRTHLYQRAVQTGLGHRDVLIVYTLWMAVALGVAAASVLGAAAIAIGWAVTLAALALVWRWVVSREAQPKPDPSG